MVFLMEGGEGGISIKRKGECGGYKGEKLGVRGGNVIVASTLRPWGGVL